jgi:hypothetical protein
VEAALSAGFDVITIDTWLSVIPQVWQALFLHSITFATQNVSSFLLPLALCPNKTHAITNGANFLSSSSDHRSHRHAQPPCACHGARATV